MRVKFTQETADVQRGEDSKGHVDRNQGAARAISQFIDPALSWKDIEWLRSVTKLPLVLKGVQTAEDAVLAAERGLDGIVCSNHGGRQVWVHAVGVGPGAVESLWVMGPRVCCSWTRRDPASRCWWR
jgi:L-lactate dehydrogenase (cytochrome)